MSTKSIIKTNVRDPDRPFPENTILVIGAGHFGGRAIRILATGSQKPPVIVDQDQDRLDYIIDPGVIKIRSEGVQFLLKYAAQLRPNHWIIPAVPIHLALEWLIRRLSGQSPPRSVERLSLSKESFPKLPHAWEGRDGSLLISYAGFRCPDDCPEPAEGCTVTGAPRLKPLHALLAETDLPGFRNLVIESRQLAPGLGGYEFAALERLLQSVLEFGKSKWLIATACKCHGVMTAMEVA